jgi:hypothetical protein
VFLIGNPLGILEGSVTSGIVSGIRTIKDGLQIIQTDASANPGSSGGPLLNAQGEVIGVLSFKLKGTENLNFVIPINYARGLLNIRDSFTLKEFNEKTQSTRTAFSETGADVLPKMWRSMYSGSTKIVRRSGDTIYTENIMPPKLKEIGLGAITEAKKDGNSYKGSVRVSVPCIYKEFWGGTKQKICYFEYPVELTMVTPTRIEGHSTQVKRNAELDCRSCTYDPPDREDVPFVWLPE